MADKQKVLIIEDETALLYALNAELSTAGFQVLTSADGEEGLEQMKKASIMCTPMEWKWIFSGARIRDGG